MELSDILPPERVLCGVSVTSKKRALELASEVLASHDQAGFQGVVFDSLIARERLGSTGFGNGVAIPHGRVKNITETMVLFIQLVEPIEYDAIDGKPVDLLFVLVVPEESTDEHLQILSQLAEMFSDKALCRALRECEDKHLLHTLVTDWQKGG